MLGISISENDELKSLRNIKSNSTPNKQVEFKTKPQYLLH